MSSFVKVTVCTIPVSRMHLLGSRWEKTGLDVDKRRSGEGGFDDCRDALSAKAVKRSGSSRRPRLD